MRRVHSLVVPDGQRNRNISLYAGDLSRIPADQPVDLLVVSAFPDSYAPMPGTLIGALHARGLSIAELAVDKAVDLRRVSGFWLSRPLGDHPAGLPIGRIACFEPLALGEPPQVVGELFRGLFPFLDQDRDAVVALTLPATGNQHWPAEAVFGPLLDAAHHWLRRGMSIGELRIAEIREDRVRDLEKQFTAFEAALPLPAVATREALPAPAPPPAAARRSTIRWFWPFTWPGRGGPDEPHPASPAPGPATHDHYDVFLSYAEEDTDAAARVIALLKAEIDGLRVFDYRFSIDIGQSWQQEIDEAIEGSRKIVALMSADYFASPECKEELMIARLRNKRSNFEVLFPLYWKDAGQALALWIQATTYSDCREADQARLGEVARRLAAQLR